MVIPTLSRQRQVDLKVSLVYTRFQDSQDYDNKNCLKKKKGNKRYQVVKKPIRFYIRTVW